MRVFVCPNSRIFGELLNVCAYPWSHSAEPVSTFSNNFVLSLTRAPKPFGGTHFAFKRVRRGVPGTGEIG